MAEKRLTHIEDITKMLQEKMPTDRDYKYGYAYAIGVIGRYAKEYRGEWVRTNVLQDNGAGEWRPTTNARICSACGSEAYWDHEWGTHLFKYCPYCGARMNKGE